VQTEAEILCALTRICRDVLAVLSDDFGCKVEEVVKCVGERSECSEWLAVAVLCDTAQHKADHRCISNFTSLVLQCFRIVARSHKSLTARFGEELEILDAAARLLQG
jgi:hypothetical protein